MNLEETLHTTINDYSDENGEPLTLLEYIKRGERFFCFINLPPENIYNLNKRTNNTPLLLEIDNLLLEKK